jgi:DNA-binding NarL/FixJ family response regulator
MSVRIIIADDHKMFRDGFCRMLEEQPDIEVVGEADNGRTAVQLALELVPDIIIMDISMPGMNGIEAVHRILSEQPKIKVISLSMHADEKYVSMMLKAGAKGYILKDRPFDDMVDAIHNVLEDNVFLCPEIVNVVAHDYVKQLPAQRRTSTHILTEREREVLRLLADGKSTKEAAAMLFVSNKAIEAHRQRMMKKLNINNIPDLTKYAIREKLTAL